jgi:hypothetical protein
VSFAEGEPKRKMQKKYAKILVYKKKVVILHRGFVRALGAHHKKEREWGRHVGGF